MPPTRPRALLDSGPAPSAGGDFDPLLAQIEPRGETYEPALDRARLGRQMAAVLRLMADGGWWTLAELAAAAGGSEAGVSARVRDARKLGHVVERARVPGASGLWRYRLGGRAA